MKNLHDVLTHIRDRCGLWDWRPTPQDIASLFADLETFAKSGKTRPRACLHLEICLSTFFSVLPQLRQSAWLSFSCYTTIKLHKNKNEFSWRSRTKLNPRNNSIRRGLETIHKTSFNRTYEWHIVLRKGSGVIVLHPQPTLRMWLGARWSYPPRRSENGYQMSFLFHVLILSLHGTIDGAARWAATTLRLQKKVVHVKCVVKYVTLRKWSPRMGTTNAIAHCPFYCSWGSRFCRKSFSCARCSGVAN